jgi:hypothetical protein
MKLDQIINNDFPKPKKKLETLSCSEMQATQFEPLQRHRWVFDIEGIDEFLMKKVSIPKISMNADSSACVSDGLNPSNIFYAPSDVVKFTLYDAVCPSSLMQIKEWTNSAEWRTSTLKMLDPIGTVVSIWEMNLLIKSFQMSCLDYQAVGAVEVDVEAFARDIKISTK